MSNISRHYLRAFIFGSFFVIIVGTLAVLFHPFSIICTQAPAEDERIICHQGVHLYHVTADGTRLSGWFYNRGKGKTLIICYPGNSCNVAMYLNLAEKDTAHSYLLFNYRGYGSGEGRAQEETMVSDAEELLSVYHQLTETHKVVLMGFSLGTCVAIRVAAKHPDIIQKVILICPFDSMLNIAAKNVPVYHKWRIRDAFDVTADAEKVSCDTSVIIAQQDRIVPLARTQALMAHFRVPLHIASFPGGHADILALPSFQAHIRQQLMDTALNATTQPYPPEAEILP